VSSQESINVRKVVLIRAWSSASRTRKRRRGSVAPPGRRPSGTRPAWKTSPRRFPEIGRREGDGGQDHGPYQGDVPAAFESQTAQSVREGSHEGASASDLGYLLRLPVEGRPVVIPWIGRSILMKQYRF